MCNHHKPKDKEIYDTRYQTYYVDKDTLMIDNNCKAICSEVQQKTCTILQHAEQLAINRKKEKEKKILLKFNKKNLC